MKFTELEKMVLKCIAEDYAVSDKIDYLLDDNYSWFTVEDISKDIKKSSKIVRGVVSSLVQKGVIDNGNEIPCLNYCFLEELQEKNIESLFEIL